MQVDNKNYMMNNTPHFTAIRSVRCSGLYKKFPEQGKELVEAFKRNPEAKDFCKKYDVNIVFYAIENAYSRVESSIHIFYDNIAKSKLKRFFDSLTGKSKDEISLHSWSAKYGKNEGIKDSTAQLKDMILPENAGTNRAHNGMLSSHLNFADERMQSVLAKRAQKAAKKQAEANAKFVAGEQAKRDNRALEDSIKDLVENGK